MIFEKLNKKSIYVNRNLIPILLSHCIYCIGDAFQIVGITLLLIKITNSGLAAGFELICMPAATVILFPISLKIIDKFPEKCFLSLLSIMRTIVGLSFLRADNLMTVYILVILNASINIFYNPLIKKSLKNAVEHDQLVVAHSLLNSVTGMAYLASPMAAGLIIKLYDIGSAWIFSSAIFTFASFINYQTPKSIKGTNTTMIYRDKTPYPDKIHINKDTLSYYVSTPNIKKLVLTNALVHFAIASVDLAFYILAFDVLGAPSRVWGFITSIYNGASMIVFLVPFIYAKKDKQSLKLDIYRAIIFLSLPWLFYGIIDRWALIFIGLFIEGISQALFNIFLNTKLQLSTPSEYIGGIMVINDMIVSIGILISIGLTYYCLEMVSYKMIFFINFSILLIFSTYKAKFIVPKG